VALLGTVLLTACASRPINQPITQVDPHSGYRGNVLMPKRQNNDISTLFVLSFSGGGTRAAALSYGVLKELHSVEITTPSGEKRRLIDEVDVITGVSGGSFTALSYALYGNELFDSYEQRFLKRNVQGDLAKRSFLYPSNWFKLASRNYGRSEIAEDLYDEILFNNATFNDLMDKNTPLAFASTTNITTGARFAYYQDDFDLICSDLGTVKLSQAAATSSAVPLVLSPVTLNNYGGSCGYKYPAWVAAVKNMDPHMRPAGRPLERYKEMAEFQDSAKSPYIHLVDGGVSDNIGVRGVLDQLEGFFISNEFQEEKGFGIINRIIVLVVNARSSHDRDWEQKEASPGSIKQLSQSTGVPIERYSFETVELMKDRVEVASWRRELAVAKAQLAGATEAEAEAMFPKKDVKVMDVTFDHLSDPAEKAYFENLPTSFVLKEEQVDRLIEVSGRLMRQSPTYQQILQSMGAITTTPATPATTAPATE
jgi:NTE family protein